MRTKRTDTSINVSLRYFFPQKVESVFNEMDCTSPVIYLLSAGADPTDSIESLARKKRHDISCVSMGEVRHGHGTRVYRAEEQYAKFDGVWGLQTPLTDTAGQMNVSL